MTTPVEKRNHAKFCEFHGEVGHNTDECMHLKKQIEEMLKAGKLSHLIKELKLFNGKGQPKVSLSHNLEILFPSLGEDKGTEGPMIHRGRKYGEATVYIENECGTADHLKILYEHCFSRLRPKIKKQLIPSTTPLIGFSGEIIWPIGQIQLLVTIGDEEHFASAWMNFMVVRSSSPYNGIIGRPGVKKLQAVPSTAHRMLKIPVEGGVITLKSNTRGSGETYGGKNNEVHYHDWLSNPVMVKKHDDSWRMCVDFKDLNKACPKDGYPLPEIDWKVESLCGLPFTCFLDADKGYHQIQMAKEDKEKTAFITSQGIFCYTKMPFGLRNAGATYQRLVDKAFHKQVGRNLEVYVDDLVIKSHTEEKIARDIEETFKTLREIYMKLNPKKCTFRVEEGMFLGYKVNYKGLKVCPDKVDDVLMEKEEHIVYLAAVKETVRAVLMTEREAKQMPIYFVSRALRGTSVIVITDQPIQQILSRPEVAGRLQKWSIELGEYAIHYRPRVSVKGHILADFIVERPEEDSPDTPMEEEEKLPEPWILFTDGSSCIDGSGAGLILTNPEGMEFTYALRFRFDATKNEAEYEALIAGLRIAEQMGAKNLQANVNSCLVANKVNGTYVAKEADMVCYLEKVKELTGSFKAFIIKQIPRSENKKADALSKIASISFSHLSKQVLVEELKEKSISEVEVLTVVEEEEDT
ncbi:reverse transcriptase domain-containing protein [Tanacetum coccineum]